MCRGNVRKGPSGRTNAAGDTAGPKTPLRQFDSVKTAEDWEITSRVNRVKDP